MPVPERSFSLRPDRIIMRMETDESLDMTEGMAGLAVQYAHQYMPKITGSLAMSLRPVFGLAFWGIYFPDRRAWFLEKGTNPFTMNSLAGKTIPMWVDDPHGEIAKEVGRKAQTRVTVDGRKQTKIFRKAAKKGERKNVMRNGRMVSVPKSYPGAPGRISNRGAGGKIGTPNGGVRWRHPGILAKGYLNESMLQAALDYGLTPDYFDLVDSATFSVATRS